MHVAELHFPQYIFMAWCLVQKRDNFTITLPLLVVFLLFSDWGELCLSRTGLGVQHPFSQFPLISLGSYILCSGKVCEM
jgi:dipeptide/tripeptide permease